MLVKEKTRGEIENKFSEMGDYVKIDYLSSCLRNKIDFDTRKFVLVKLAGLYEEKKMYNNAGECMKNAAEINTSTQNKIGDFLKAIDLFINGGDYTSAENCMRTALSYGDEKEKNRINEIVKQNYKTRAKFLSSAGKRKGAMEIYEVLMEMKLDKSEKDEIGKELLYMYDKLGKIREYYSLKGKIN